MHESLGLAVAFVFGLFVGVSSMYFYYAKRVKAIKTAKQEVEKPEKK